MRFFIRKHKASLSPEHPDSSNHGLRITIDAGVQEKKVLQLPQGTLTLVGDPVPNAGLVTISDIVTMDPTQVLKQVITHFGGHYYWILEKGNSIMIGGSFANILPIYYASTSKEIIIGSRIEDVIEPLDELTLNETNLLERYVFNYTFTNNTWWREVNLLPTHSILWIKGDTVEMKKVEIPLLDEAVPVRSDRSGLSDIVDEFIDRSKKYYPDTGCGISLTGGFDGRTLVSTAIHHGKPFFTYSFGRGDSKDVQVASSIARTSDFEYSPILLNNEYVKNEGVQSAIDFLIKSEFNGNLGRPHYLYAAKILSHRTRHIITGNFGSELFRALHLPGVMMSKTLIDIFAGVQGWEQQIIDKATTLPLKRRKQVCDEVIGMIKDYLHRNNYSNKNHTFYHYATQEIFRKYFGPELVMQSHYLINRTPYLDYPFILSLNKTRWSGIHSSLFEKSKLKRMKGQEFYAALLKRTDNKLYRAKTSKGYSPRDLHSLTGLLNIIKAVALRKLLSSETDENNLGYLLNTHMAELKELIVETVGNIDVLREKEMTSESNMIAQIHKMSLQMGWANAKKIKEAKSQLLVNT